MEQFTAAYKDALSKYAEFGGRLSVGGYWRFFAVNFLISVVLYLLAMAVSALIVVYIVYGLATLIPGLAAAVRRLHDTGKSGWYLLISLIPFVGVILLIVWLVKAGDNNSNTYGPPAI